MLVNVSIGYTADLPVAIVSLLFSVLCWRQPMFSDGHKPASYVHVGCINRTTNVTHWMALSENTAPTTSDLCPLQPVATYRRCTALLNLRTFSLSLTFCLLFSLPPSVCLSLLFMYHSLIATLSLVSFYSFLIKLFWFVWPHLLLLVRPDNVPSTSSSPPLVPSYP